MGATYMECSSKEMIGVEEIFDKAVTLAVGDEYRQRPEPGRPTSQFPVGGKKKKKSSCKFL